MNLPRNLYTIIEEEEEEIPLSDEPTVKATQNVIFIQNTVIRGRTPPLSPSKPRDAMLQNFNTIRTDQFSDNDLHYYFDGENEWYESKFGWSLAASHYRERPERDYFDDDASFQRLKRRHTPSHEIFQREKIDSFNANFEFIRFSNETIGQLRDVAHHHNVAGKVSDGRLRPYYDIMKATMPAYFGKKSVEELEFDGTEIQKY